MKKLCLILYFLSAPLFANQNKIFSIEFGPVKIGESRLNIDLDNFSILYKKRDPKLSAYFVPGSVQWIRTSHNLLVPRARIRVKYAQNSSNIFFKYLGQTILPEKVKGGIETELYVNLFNPGDIIVKRDGTTMNSVTVEAEAADENEKTVLIDYSCSKYNIKIKGLEKQYLSVGCRLMRLGQIGEETPRLEITMSTTNYRLADGTRPPFMTILHGNEPTTVEMYDHKKRRHKVSIQATLPKRLHRLKTAWGFGPYPFKAAQGTLEKKSRLAPAFFLYGKYQLGTETSLKMFNGLIFNKESLFNNFGFYFSYVLANAMDGRFSIVPLLGAQGLTFKYDRGFADKTSFIFPQGFEAILRHPFGQENYTLVYGMFLPTSNEDNYRNIWLRYGKKIFWELNLITWQTSNVRSTLYGISIGVPLGQFW